MEGVWDRRQCGSFEELQRGQVTGANRGREQVTQVKIKKKREREKRKGQITKEHIQHLDFDPRAKGSYLNFNNDPIKFKSTFLLQGRGGKKKSSQMTRPKSSEGHR